MRDEARGPAPHRFSRFRGARAVAAAAAMLLGACAPRAAVVSPVGTLPPVPARTGAIAIDVVYPAEDQVVAVRDSNFVFGSVGTGDAQLRINGAPVEVAANGAFLAFLPVPADGAYNLEATARGETRTATRRVRLPTAATLPSDAPGVHILEGSVSPSGVMTRVRGERVQVRVRGTPGARASVLLPDGSRVPLTEQPVLDRATWEVRPGAAPGGIAEYVGSFPLTTTILGTDTVAPRVALREGYVEPRDQVQPRPAVIELAIGDRRATAPIPAAIGVLDPGAPRAAVADTDRADGTVMGRKLPGPNQPWLWQFPNTTRLTVDGESDGFYRVRLAEEMHVWVPSADVRLLPEGVPAPRGEISLINVRPGEAEAVVAFSMTERLPYHIEPRARGLRITFYGGTIRTGIAQYGPTSPFVQALRWGQERDGVYWAEVELGEALWGFQHGWNAQGNLELRLRRPPLVDPRAPLRGLTIAVDAGHPPGGAIGPTRLTEADAVLMVTRRMVPMLERAGARVVEIRPDTGTVPLIQRPIMATETDSHLFVSVHYNAFPDGVNPFRNHGTMMLFFWEHSLEFARHLQREIQRELGEPDLGVRFQDVAIARTSWMPSVLTESMFMMLPEREAAMRDAGVQERVAAAHVRAMESFVREHGRR
jgi:N-acetylmuramoyl-L-alanine amidase